MDDLGMVETERPGVVDEQVRIWRRDADQADFERHSILGLLDRKGRPTVQDRGEVAPNLRSQVDDDEDRGVEARRQALKENFERSDAAGGPNDGYDMDRRPVNRREPSRFRRARGE
jgi:hypothetical protein